jgi:hypothetical protein
MHWEVPSLNFAVYRICDLDRNKETTGYRRLAISLDHNWQDTGPAVGVLEIQKKFCLLSTVKNVHGVKQDMNELHTDCRNSIFNLKAQGC